jgi:hypothetical protein
LDEALDDGGADAEKIDARVDERVVEVEDDDPRERRLG